MQIIIFIILALLVLASSHYLLYFAIIHFFPLSLLSKKIFLLAIIFLALSFIISMFLSRFSENFFTRALYFASGFWLGLLTNLLLASIFIWLVLYVFRGVNIPILASLLFLLALVYSLYGVFNAFNPKLTNISVTISNLPQTWEGKKIVQLSDIHLGIIHRQDFLDSIVNKINSIKPEMVLITGDLFDGMDGDLNFLVSPIDKLNPPQGIFFVTGNHETYLGVDKVFEALAKTKVKSLKDEVVDVSGLKLIGLNFDSDINVLKSLEKDFSGRPNILLYHSPVHINDFKEAGINLQLSGHTHKGQLSPFGYITKLIYNGYDYGLHKIGDYTIYTSVGAGTWGPPMRTGNRPEITVITLSSH